MKDALKFGNECLQPIDDKWRFKNGDIPPTFGEDCLYLNIYTPQNLFHGQTDQVHGGLGLLPVMVWIHGGAYVIGAGSQYDATSLATKGVVMVTINYRLGIFGFMSSEDDVMPGNYGMWDQIEALKWVKANIAAFGGDPDRVTIFGQSAGSSSVSLLTLSPQAKGLFHRAIMQSGQSLSPFSYFFRGNKVEPRMFARTVGVSVDCNIFESANSANLLSCLQKLNASLLLNVSLGLVAAFDAEYWNPLNPRVDSPNGFLPESPVASLYYGHMNKVSGINMLFWQYFILGPR